MQNVILKMKDITKSFSGFEVLHEVEFELNKGEVHALVGENGAGKSTLMKILAGVHLPDSGKIEKFNSTTGEWDELSNLTPKSAQESGISMVFQEFNILNNMSIAENIFLGREPKNKYGILDWKQLYQNTQNLLDLVNLEHKPSVLVGSLSVAEKQLVEIAKCLSFDANIIILDEPTSALTDKESEILFSVIKQLRDAGKSLIYISHRMEEILSITDRITVFRDGNYIATMNTYETERDDLVRKMIGHKLGHEMSTDYKSYAREEVVLDVQNIDLKITQNSEPFGFQLKKGEILGFFGLVGAGRTEMARLLFGVDYNEKLKMKRDDRHIKIKSTKDAINQGIALVPEDRKELGLVMNCSVQDNIVLASLKNFHPVIWTNHRENNIARDYIRKLSIVTHSINQSVEELSGGNQQKVVLSKWLATEPEILILDEPTRGIDVGVKAEIYKMMRQIAKGGSSIIVISSEIEEILHISDRIIVLYEGKKTLDEKAEFLDQEKLMFAAIGGGTN